MMAAQPIGNTGTAMMAMMARVVNGLLRKTAAPARYARMTAARHGPCTDSSSLTFLLGL